jgi:putative glutamine amidotransferase
MKKILSVPGEPGDSEPYEAALAQIGLEMVFDLALRQVAGVLLMGGTDVNPSRYGQQPGPEQEEPDDPRDERELALLTAALADNLPIFAICRGMQILNVHCGGTLIHHLDTVSRHRQLPRDKSENAHPIQIVPRTRLAQIAGPELLTMVNSRHHQAVDRVGDGLLVSATDPEDGVVEAVELPGKRFVIGVQWHPENQLAARDSISAKLFQAFLDAVR